ncbi:CBS domain-containing protein [Pelagibacteraceae bacterium]|nr:CBS domain-containing protein [Pelagibacteraceae bacterium]
MVKKLLFHLKIDYLLQINSNNTMPGKLVSRMSKRECYTLTEIDTVKTASQNLHEKKIGSMPVLDKNNNVIGIISERDLSQFIYTERFNLNLPVTKIMSKNLVSCDLNTSVTELMDIMTDKKIRHVLIIEDKKLNGIVSIGDVVNHLINKIKEENENLRGYINSY